ncbi:hypothetical protein GCM10007049_20030 [Echinicola pacifica]|uniref:Uncharacterized protein n=1 Tax=Echinicola pacifica TaxID=346377 RepID=A0A918PYB8_9BACT|nr:hypothetical protein GCM10007049_20030 [Echinicola pacifica]
MWKQGEIYRGETSGLDVQRIQFLIPDAHLGYQIIIRSANPIIASFLGAVVSLAFSQGFFP